MKQWEDQQRLKTYNTKIKNAKSSVGTKKLTSSKVNSSMNDSQSISMLRSPGSNSKAPNTPYSDNGSISDYLEWEKFDHTQIPLYKLLQKANLQQYAQQLISRGYGYDLMKFTYLPKREIEILFEDIKVLPGHQTKFHSLIDYIADIGPAILDSSDSRSFTPAMSQKSMFTNTNFIQNNFQSPQQQNHLFTQQVAPTLINIDIEEMCYCLSCAILKHIENYQKILNNESMIMDSSFIQEFRNKQTDYYKNKLAEIKEVPGQHLSDQNSSHNDTTTQVDVSGDISKNITNPMQEPTQIQDDYKDVSIDASQYIKGEMNSNSKPANIKRQFDSYRGEIQNILKQSLLMRNYHTNTRDDQGLEQSKLQPQLNIGNEDISILPHQENGNLCSDEDEAQGFDLNASADSAGQQIEGNEFFEVNESEKQSSQELRQRLQAEPDEDEVAYSDEEDKSHSNIMDQYQNAAQKQELDDSSNMYHNRHDNSEDPGLSKSMYEAGDSMEDGDEENQQDSSGLQFSFISQITTVIVDEQNIDDIVSNKRLFEKTFNESDETMRFFSQPNKDVVANYCKNVIITTKMEKEVPIVALVYIERLLITSGFGLTGLNWRQITFTALILASQIWDDQSFENDNFARAFPDFTTREINEMERVFLNFIGYSLYVKGSDYAQYYFVLRTFADQNKQSFPLRPLDLQTIIYLQRNSNRAQRSLREAYLNPLNKSF